MITNACDGKEWNLNFLPERSKEYISQKKNLQGTKIDV